MYVWLSSILTLFRQRLENPLFLQRHFSVGPEALRDGMPHMAVMWHICEKKSVISLKLSIDIPIDSAVLQGLLPESNSSTLVK